MVDLTEDEAFQNAVVDVAVAVRMLDTLMSRAAGDRADQTEQDDLMVLVIQGCFRLLVAVDRIIALRPDLSLRTGLVTPAVALN